MKRLILCFVLMHVAGCMPAQDSGGGSVNYLKIHGGEHPSGPRLSAGADGTVVLSWMEPDASGTTLWYSRLTADGWQSPKAVVTGVRMFVNWADLPSVTALTGTHWVAHWLEMAGSTTYAYHVVVSQSFDGGESWSEPLKPHTDDTPTEHGFVSLFAQNGDVAAIWLDGRKTGNEPSGDPTASGMTLRAAVIDADGNLHHEQLIDELICDCCQTDVAVAESGPVAVYRNRTVDEIRDIYVTRNVDAAWTAGESLNNDNWLIAGCPVNGPAIAARGNRVAAAWFTAANQDTAVSLKLSADGGESFGDQIPVAAGGTLGHVDTVILPDNSVVVSWLQMNADELGSLMVRRVAFDVTASADYTVSTSVNKRSVPQMANVGNDLVFVWTDSSDAAPRIRSARHSSESLPFADR